MNNKCKKNILILITGCFLAGSVFAQANYPNIVEKTLSNGIPVYYMENNTNKIDSIIVGVKGGTKYYTPELSGIESATFMMMAKGSDNYTYDDLQRLKYLTSAKVMASSGYYGSELILNSIDDYLDQTLPMLLDGFVHPTFKTSEYEKIMNDYINSVQSTLNDGYSMANYFANKVITENHPYGTSAGVTPESIDNITLDAIRNYYSTILDSRRFYIIACTKSPLESIMSYFEEYLGSIPAGDSPFLQQELPPLNVKHEPMVFTHQSVAGSGYIFRMIPAPSCKSDEIIPFMVAETIYSKTMYNVVRTKYGACYSIWSSDSGNEVNTAKEIIYRCSNFDDIKAKVAEARKITSEGKYILSVKDEGSYVLGDIKDDFEGFRNSLINSLYSSDMTTGARTSMLNSSLLIWGNTTGIYDLRAELNTVTYEQVINVFNKYFMSNDEFWYAVTGPDEEEVVTEALNK